VKSSGDKKHIHALIKENSVDKDKGHLNHKDLYSVVFKDRTLLAFCNVEILLLRRMIFAVKSHQE
jgi:hypothetical protein